MGDSFTVFYALASAAYARPVFEKAHFKFMPLLSPWYFRLIFGIHSFIPLLMKIHATLPGKLYGKLCYPIFSDRNGSDVENWDRGLRDRMSQVSPVYLCAESMLWWLGNGCFAQQKCILATREACDAEDKESVMSICSQNENKVDNSLEGKIDDMPKVPLECEKIINKNSEGSIAWFNHQVPSFALWVAG